MIVALGIGPGSLELLTGEARQALERADVVVGYKPYIELIRPLLREKQVEASGMRQEVDRCRHALALSREGLTVAVVSSGDAGVYGMAGLLMELDPAADIEVVPGITACQAAAARLGAPLMNDFAVLSLSDLLTPREEVLRRVRAVAAADLVCCLYNPTSRRRRPLFQDAVGLFLAERPAEAVVGWVKNAYREGEELHLTTLAELAAEPVDMWSVVVVGSSRTELLAGKMVTRRGYREKYGTDETAEDARERVREQAPAGSPGPQSTALGGAGEESAFSSWPEARRGRRVYLLGGTSFARGLVRELEQAGVAVRLSVATALGAAEVEEPPSGGVQAGPLDERGLLEELAAWGPTALVDATHPYAVEVSQLARRVTEASELPLLRACRPAWDPPGEDGLPVRLFATAEELAQALEEAGEKAFLTVGAKGLRSFAGRGLALAARVLPTTESVAAALEAGISPEDLVAAYPPYDPAFTAACLARTGATVIVSKESGREGGLDEKLQAARLAGARLFVVGRPQEEGPVYHDAATLIEGLEELWRRS